MGKSVRWLDPLVTLEVPHHWPANIENKRDSVSDIMKTYYQNGILKNTEKDIKRNYTSQMIVQPTIIASRQPDRHINYVRITCIVIFVLFIYFFAKRMFK